MPALLALLNTFLLLALLGSAPLRAQRWEVGAGAGVVGYYGDLNAFGLIFKNPQFGAGALVRYHLGTHVALRASLTRGRIVGDDAFFEQPAWRRQRGHRFSSPLTDVSLTAEWYPLGTRRRLSPYLLAGAGLVFVDPATVYNPRYLASATGPITRAAFAADQARTRAAGYPAVPVGLGLRLRLSEQFAAQLDLVFPFALTDYLDGVSQVADPRRNDSYDLFTLGLCYRFRRKTAASE